jgi:para-nitrobenzyl esterase
VASTIVQTRAGKICGAAQGDLVVFRGVPYAAPPTGPLRWLPPQQVESWLGVRDCTEFGPIAPQVETLPGLSLSGGQEEMSEDCLTLNVWTPGCDDARRPVLLFIHGGGYVAGAGSVMVYDGTSLAGRDVVVVTVNYRLGALGYLAHESFADPISGAGCGNWGLADQLEAVRWVRDHAAAFGGDAANMTVFGESAGAMSISALLGSPSARGLFGRAIIQSGNVQASTPGVARSVAERLAGELGLADVTRSALQRVPVAEVLAAQQRCQAAIDETAGLAFQPVIDGGLLPRHPAIEIATGGARDVELLIGTNRDEWKFFTFSTPGLADVDEERLGKLVQRYLDTTGAARRATEGELVDAYRSARSERGAATTPLELYAAIASDWVFRVPSLRLAEAQAAYQPNTFSYLFDWESPLGAGLGSCHALDLPFVFGTIRNPALSMFAGIGDEAIRLSEQMQSAWIAFARTGNPSCEDLGEWPAYEPQWRATMVLGADCGVTRAPLEAERQVIDRAFGRFGVGGAIERECDSGGRSGSEVVTADAGISGT